MNWSDYFANLWLAIQGKTKCSKEAFDNHTPHLSFLLILPFILIITFSYSFGAALLSYHYGVYKGDPAALFWAIIAYFFSGLYYPFYAFFLDPLSTMTPEIKLPVPGAGRRK